MIAIRWRIFSFLFGFGFVAYVQQKCITVVAERMMPDLGLSQSQIGWIEEAFVVGYALCQMPGGVLGERYGARRTFAVIGLLAVAATLAMPLAPALFSGRPLFIGLLCAQLLLGCSQGAIFPISAGVFEAWFPPKRWAFVQGLQTMGLGLGAALTPPLIVSLMTSLGWKNALVWSSLPPLGLIALWAWYGRNTPREHASVTTEELAQIGDHHSAPAAAVSLRQLFALVRNRNVLLLAISYLFMNYNFYLLSNWVFLYLVQERHFSLLEGGWLAVAPPLAAALGAGIGGVITSALCQRVGNGWGFRAMPLIALPGSALLLLYAVNAADPYWAVFALATCFFCIELTEGSFWGAGMAVGRGDSMAICGFMNTGGNLGGMIGIPIVAHFSELHSWHSAFFVGVGFAIISAVAWLGIRVAEVRQTDAPLPIEPAVAGAF